MMLLLFPVPEMQRIVPGRHSHLFPKGIFQIQVPSKVKSFFPIRHTGTHNIPPFLQQSALFFLIIPQDVLAIHSDSVSVQYISLFGSGNIIIKVVYKVHSIWYNKIESFSHISFL